MPKLLWKAVTLRTLVVFVVCISSSSFPFSIVKVVSSFLSYTNLPGFLRGSILLVDAVFDYSDKLGEHSKVGFIVVIINLDVLHRWLLLGSKPVSLRGPVCELVLCISGSTDEKRVLFVALPFPSGTL